MNEEPHKIQEPHHVPEPRELPKEREMKDHPVTEIEKPKSEEEKLPEEPPRELLEVDDKNMPLCPRTNIQASNFFLADSTKNAVNCVLCSNSRDELRRMPQLNLSLSLVLNEKLADQLFNQDSFAKANWEGQVDEMLSDFRTNFDDQCKSLKEMMMERLQNESHEFMLKKIKTFLDQARNEYKEDPKDFLKLQELCSTFNDFLLLKKSDEVATAMQEIDTYKSYFTQMKRTLGVNFKYLKSKIDGKIHDDSKSQKSTSRIMDPSPQIMTMHKPMETSVVVNSTKPVSYSYTTPTQIKPQPNRVIVQNQDQGFFDNIPPTYIMNSSRGYTPTEETPKSSQYPNKHVDTRGVSPGLRTIKKVRVSQRSGTPTQTKIIRRSGNQDAHHGRNIVHQNGVSKSPSRIPPGYTETITNVNGIKVIRRSISAHSRPTNIVRNSPTEDNKKKVVQFTSRANFQELNKKAPTFSTLNDVVDQSTLLRSPASRSFVKSVLFPNPITLTLLYRGSRDGLSAATFHKKCDHRGATISIFRAKETGAIFGGYNDRLWMSSNNGDSLPSDQAFLFSVDKRTKHSLTNLNKQNAICCFSKHGPIYGKFNNFMNNVSYYQYDLFISLDSTPSTSTLGKTYQLPEGIYPDSMEAKTFLAGMPTFSVDEIEVYAVTHKRGFN